MNLFHGGHAGGKNHRSAHCSQVAQQIMISEGCRRDFVTNGVELLQEIHTWFIPNGCKPGHANLLAVTVDFRVFILTKFHLVTVIQVGNVSPGSITHLSPLLGRYTQFRSAFLKFDCVHIGMTGSINQLLGDFHITIMVDANFRDNIGGLILSNQPVANLHLFTHVFNS